jgi:ABC-type antimicrobial peptide transport system permease subunit
MSAENFSTLDVNTAEKSVPDAGRGTKDAITTDSDGWVYIASESDQAATVNTKIVVLPPIAKREAVVNRSMLRVLGIDENDAVGKRFTSSFVATGDLLPAGESKIESSGDEYLIVGVVPGDKTPIFYVPFIDLRSMGIVNYSQATIVANHDKDVADIRKKIEAMGYATSSVVDTIDQINSLFSTVRVMLGLLGAVALAVASLGMFNTLTVSLLERTREVGLMKTMGMKSDEVRELFLTESMTMGFFGGVIGILLGYIGGKLLGLILSVFSLTKGFGFLDITYIPSSFILLIIFLSLLVGIFTGIYPAKRATRISALDALRYE